MAGQHGRVSRRDFIKVASYGSILAATQSVVQLSRLGRDESLPNIIVLVFDAWSADHLFMNGYPRRTMPNLERFAEQAIVYHRHYSAGTFTVPGTAALLTGLYPWTHRALTLGGEIAPEHRGHQLFNLGVTSHYTLGFSQNEYADVLISQMEGDLDAHLRSDAFSLHRNLLYTTPLLGNDARMAQTVFEHDIFTQGRDPDASLFLGPLRRLLRWRSVAILDAEYKMTYPRGLPVTLDMFKLEDVIDGVIGVLGRLPRPSLAYMHLYPPHADYRPKGKYSHSFEDGWQPAPKPEHVLAWEKPGAAAEGTQRLHYDQYLASWDAELARLLDYLTTSGVLDNSYVIITSDHGEMFERGVIGHMTPLIYDPIVHVPLIISTPGRTKRIDVHTPTSSVDLLPTVAGLAGLAAPPWASGRLLPELGGASDPGRSIFTIDAKTNSAFAALDKLSVGMTKGGYRLTYYQYPDLDYKGFELYDLLDDPEEMHDIYASGSPVAAQLQDELLHELDAANRALHE